MEKNFTLTQPTSMKKVKIEPKASTVNFIKQFARVCAFRKMMHAELGVFIMN